MKLLKFVVEKTDEGYRAYCNKRTAIYFLGRSEEEALGEVIKANRGHLADLGVSIKLPDFLGWLSLCWPNRLRFRIDPEKECLLVIRKIAEGEGSVTDRFYEIKTALNRMYPKTYTSPEKPK